MYTLIIQNRIVGCHGNDPISQNPNFFLWGGDSSEKKCIYLISVNNLVPMQNCPGNGVQGRSN